MKKVVAVMLGLATGLAAPVLVALPARASPNHDTTTTFTISAGSLDLTVPSMVNLGSGGRGATISGHMGAIAVADSRAAADASWTATVLSDDFTTAGGSATETVLASQVDYWSGPPTATTGNGTFTPGQISSASSEALDNTIDVTAYVHTGGTGGNTTTWNPTLQVNVPGGNARGVYSGRVTHSLA
jgi:hypothetical protein